MDSEALQVMDLTSLRAVLKDLSEKILPSRFEKAQQPQAKTLQIGLRTLVGMIWIELSWNADAPRLVQINPPSKLLGDSTFAKQYQHSLREMALIEIKQEGFERIVELGFSRRPGEAIEKTIVIELMGRHSNVLLLDSERRVITIGRQIREHQSRIRPIGTGDQYLPPPALQGIRPLREESLDCWKERLCLIPTSLKKALQETYQGISPSLALQIAHDQRETAQSLLDIPVLDISQQKWESLYFRWCLWLKRLEEGEFSLSFDGPTPYRFWKEGKDDSDTQRDFSIELGTYFQNHLEAKNLRQLSKELKQKLLRLKKDEESSLKNQEQLLINTSNSASLQEEADLLLCHPSPDKEIIDKAQKLYQKSKKLRRSVLMLKERIHYHNEKLQTILGSEVFLEQILSNTWEKKDRKLKNLDELNKEIDDLINSRNHRKKQTSNRQTKRNLSSQFIELTTPRGVLIQIGRNHRQNELISLRLARNGDLWFHAQESPGSHIVLKASCHLVEDEDLQIAADLAAFFSKAKGNKRVPVVMVPTKQLQRITGTIAGTVTHRGGKVIWGEPSKAIKHIGS